MYDRPNTVHPLQFEKRQGLEITRMKCGVYVPSLSRPPAHIKTSSPQCNHLQSIPLILVLVMNNVYDLKIKKDVAVFLYGACF